MLYLVDNSLVTGNNDGAEWPNAFRSIADLEDALTVEGTDTILIKATGIPHREKLGNSNKFNNKTIYCNAVGGTGQETYLGRDKATFMGSIDATAFTWVQEGASTVYRCDDVDLGPYTPAPPVLSTSVVAWYYESPTNIIRLLGKGTYQPASPYTSLALNRAAYNATTKKVWINIGEDPNGKHVEIIYMTTVVEVWTNFRLYNFISKHGLYGTSNFGCHNWIVEGAEVIQNRIGAFHIATDLDSSSFYKNSYIHDNYSHGVHLIGGIVRNQYYSNNLVCFNGGNGMNLAPINDSVDPREMLYILRNVVYGNGGRGIYVKDDSYPGEFVNLTIKNNIVLGNTGEQLYLFNTSERLSFNVSNNCPGAINPYGGVWEANKGTGNVEIDPLMVDPANDDFHLQTGSPVLNKGVDDGILRDYEGNYVPVGTSDMGAYQHGAITEEQIKAVASGGLLVESGQGTPNSSGLLPLGIKGVTT